MKKCPPGVFCIQNLSLGFIIILIIALCFILYKSVNSQNQGIDNNSNQRQNERLNPNPNISISLVPNYPYNNIVPKDVLLNPYAPPYKDERYLVPELNNPGIPINVSTNIGAVDTSYRQIGIITPLSGNNKDNILSLMGRPLFTNRDKWQYYTISNQHNNVKLPISFKGKSALNDYGVDKIFSGDTIYVEGYNEPFTVTIYENDTIKYLPFI